MKTYTVAQVSELLKISKDTLIYYDKLGLVKPKRGDNRYRYYTSQDILNLQFVEIAKNVDYSLEEIRLTLHNQKLHTMDSFQWQMLFMREKRAYLKRKEKHIQAMIRFMDEAEELMKQKKLRMGKSDSNELSRFIERTFWNLKEDENE